ASRSGAARAPRTQENPHLAKARPKLAKVLDELRALNSADRGTRRTYLLTESLPVLEGLTGDLQRAGVEPVAVAPLSTLVNDLKTAQQTPWIDTTEGQAAFDELWSRTLRVLDSFVQKKSEPEQPRSRSFWKRPR
ncbi:hypothetical protein ACFQ07_32085, partial [Actinomadura adrarensis]